MTYEELNSWFIEYVQTERNNIVKHNGVHSAREIELQNILSAYAARTGQDIEALNEATDKNKYYQPGQNI